MRSSAYLPVFFGSPAAEGSIIELDGDEGAHAARARRMRVGEGIRIADMHGEYADCEIVEVAGRSVRARVVQRGAVPEPRPRLAVAQALPKGDRAGLAVELMTEGGVDEIIPWQAATCVARWPDQQKAEKGRAKWQATAREAAKQSRRVRVPRIAEAVSTAQLAERIAGSTALVLHESTSDPIESIRLDGAAEIVLIVGPEGGITAGEVELLHDAGAHPVRLGPEVLRTSTAGVVALSWVASRTGRWA
ncbi:16S rRNA (uracil(1498)-N(3))-methyltransferase [Blastococcus sp. Marseille-P5729]|uniref:16S rRNA (uracil(1498)-N(3))-methyltransferase n=1 Tax=Blastococcus sp. Marseille-P5729 TaxID=2086582 RepID=UPI001F158003|nr:16S rRNA (uracil(1498)-N(3))-methyltransferase [Blastococcus sp. Marseille-P5729]